MRRRLSVVLLAAVLARVVPAQTSDSSSVVRGTVTSSAGTPVAQANVFLLETLDGALTDDAGRFAIRSARRGPSTLVARRVGFRPAQLAITLSAVTPVAVVLEPRGAALAPVIVQAGAYTASEERGATLTPLEVVTTPGTAADVNRAIQTLPGVQQADEGTALYVRGGDFTETRVFIDGALVLNPTQLQQTTGTFVGTVDPFLLDGIFFSSGGFGARYGDALSAVAALRTQGRPARAGGSLGAGLAALSASAGVPLTRTLAVRAAANRLDLAPVLRVNGNPHGFAPPPHGHDASASAIWSYRASGSLTLFAIDQRSALGMDVDEASYSGAYDNALHTAIALASWHDALGPVGSTVSLSTSRLHKVEGYGAFQLTTGVRHDQLSALEEWTPSARVTLRGGGDVARTASAYDGSIPASGDDVRPGARVHLLGSDRAGTRVGFFGEADWRLGARTRLVTGARSDRSTLARERTVDPRLSLGVRLAPRATATAAWGIYHQLPDPLLYVDSLGAPGTPLTAMRAEQSVVGVQVGEDGATARVELFDKRYASLAALTRDHVVAAGGRGRATGADVFLKGLGPLGTTGRVTYSYVRSRRTDPSSGATAPAPFDVTHSFTGLIERGWGTNWHAAAAYRYATGRPFTPVAGAAFDSARHVWVPAYGTPMSERLPALRRLDLSGSYLRRLGASTLAVLYVAVSNVLGRENVFTYRYSPDYASRAPVRSVFTRSVYFGATLTR